MGRGASTDGWVEEAMRKVKVERCRKRGMKMQRREERKRKEGENKRRRVGRRRKHRAADKLNDEAKALGRQGKTMDDDAWSICVRMANM